LEKEIGKFRLIHKELALPGETRVLSLTRVVQLKYQQAPPVSGAPGVIGLSGRTSQGGDALGERQ
jgi:hypothetical protein